MKNKIGLKRNLSQPDILPDFSNIILNDEEKLFYKLISSIKKKKNNFSKNIEIYYNKSNKINHHKSLIKKNLESNINLSKEYKNFCGSFLYPDYTFAAGKKILKDLKLIGPEKTVCKHFTKKIPKANYIKKSNAYSITRNKRKSVIKSKYLNLIQGNQPSSNNNNFIIKTYNKSNNNIFKINNHKISNKHKKNKVLEFNKKNKIENSINNSTLMNRSSFCRHSTNNKNSYSSSSTTYKSKIIRNIKMFNLS